MANSIIKGPSPITLTLNTNGSNKYNIAAQDIYKQGRAFFFNVRLTAKASVSAGELSIGSTDLAPNFSISGVLIKTSDSSIVGSWLWSSTNGTVYINPSSALSTGQSITMSGGA